MMDNRTLILEKALHLFALRGFDAVGVQEVADTAQVAKPTLYHYFGSKHGLLLALLAENFDPFLTLLHQAGDYKGDLPGTLTQLTRAYFDFARANPMFYRLCLSLWFAPKDSEAFQSVLAYNTAQHNLIETVFSKAVVQHGNMHGRARAYATTFLGMVNTYIGMALNQYVTLDSTLVDQAVHQFQHGIYS